MRALLPEFRQWQDPSSLLRLYGASFTSRNPVRSFHIAFILSLLLIWYRKMQFYGCRTLLCPRPIARNAMEIKMQLISRNRYHNHIAHKSRRVIFFQIFTHKLPGYEKSIVVCQAQCTDKTYKNTKPLTQSIHTKTQVQTQKQIQTFVASANQISSSVTTSTSALYFCPSPT